MPTKVTRLSPYTRFEKPPALVVTFTDEVTGAALNITGYSSQARWRLLGTQPAENSATITCSLTTNGADGNVTVPWGQASPSPFGRVGSVEMEVWVGNATVRRASEIFRFAVRPSVAETAPAI